MAPSASVSPTETPPPCSSPSDCSDGYYCALHKAVKGEEAVCLPDIVALKFPNSGTYVEVFEDDASGSGFAVTSTTSDSNDDMMVHNHRSMLFQIEYQGDNTSGEKAGYLFRNLEHDCRLASSGTNQGTEVIYCVNGKQPGLRKRFRVNDHMEEIGDPDTGFTFASSEYYQLQNVYMAIQDEESLSWSSDSCFIDTANFDDCDDESATNAVDIISIHPNLASSSFS